MSCEYCHEDRDGYISPLDKNAHAYYHYPDALILRFGKEHRECKINYCPMCGRKLGEKTDNKRMTNGEKIRQMSDEELMVLLIHQRYWPAWCDDNCQTTTCLDCCLKWLKKEVKENAN